MPQISGHTDRHDMQSCIDACTSCHQTCTHTVHHCLDKGGKHADSMHITLMLDCAQICATSADCCGKPCVNNRCEATCVPQSGPCTTTADCCSGITCTIPPGGLNGICGGTLLSDGGVSDAAADTGTGSDGGGNLPDGGTCSLYGQTCTSGANCCNGVPCIGGSCHYPL